MFGMLADKKQYEVIGGIILRKMMGSFGLLTVLTKGD
jgi:hypothetical protein